MPRTCLASHPAQAGTQTVNPRGSGYILQLVAMGPLTQLQCQASAHHEWQFKLSVSIRFNNILGVPAPYQTQS